MLQISENEKLFTLHTTHSTYQMKVDEYGFLLHTYYGARVDDTDMSYTFTLCDRGFSGVPDEAGNNRRYSLDILPQEYSTFGEGDFRVSALQLINSDGSYDCDLKYKSYKVIKGKPALKGLPATYVDNSEVETLQVSLEDALTKLFGDNSEVETLQIILEDTLTKLQVMLSYSAFEKYDAITRHAVITNASAENIRLQKAASVCVDYHNSRNMDAMTFYGKHAGERTLERSKVRHGKIVVDSVRGTSSHHENPFVILCDHDASETHGNCWGYSLVYSGNFSAEIELDQANQVRMVMGINPTAFEYLMAPNDSFTTPEVVMCYSENGLGDLSRSYHKLYRNNLCRGKYKLTRRPVLINNWEATYFGFDDDKLVKIAEDASKLGIEMLVMDDGWFGKRDDDNSGLGDWIVNTNKIKGGLKPLCDRINALGMKFGIWFEPEMISEDSDLYRAHPDWKLCTAGRNGSRSRNQFVLDMSRTDVVDYIFNSMSAVLKSANIEYVKWDMNRHLCNVWSHTLPVEHQGELYHRYVLGVYDLLERLTSSFPNVLLEGCSGGGGRFDAGMLYYSPQFWCSDNTDAIDRLTIQYGTSFGYPISTMGSHVSASPNHQTFRETPLNTRGVIAMSGTFGYELDINKMTAEEKEMVKVQTETYKRNYDVINNGDYYRLTNPLENHEYAAWQFVSQDKGRALVNYVLLRSRDNPPIIDLKLEGLDKTTNYRINGEQVLSGAALMNAGISIPVVRGDFTAMQFELIKE